MLYNGRHAKSEKVGGVSSRSGWLLELLTELTRGEMQKERNDQNPAFIPLNTIHFDFL